MCDGDDERRGRGDSDAGEAAKSLGHAAAGAPSHGPATLLGRRRVELPRRGRVELRGRRGAMTVSPSGLHGRVDKAQADEVGGLGVQVDEADEVGGLGVQVDEGM